MPDIEKSGAFKTLIGDYIFKSGAFKTLIGNWVIKSGAFKTGINFLEISGAFKTAISSFIEVSGSFETRIFDSSYQNSTAIIKKYGAEAEIVVDDESFTLPLLNYSINRGLNRAMTWSITFLDPTGTRSPYSSGVWEDVLSPRIDKPVFDPDNGGYTVNKYINLTIFSNYGERKYTDLILKNLNVRETPSGVYMTLSGIDYSDLLFRSNSSMETFEKVSAWTIITSILSWFGIKDRYFKKPLENLLKNYFPVYQFDFQRTTPINRITTLLNEVGAFWQMIGKRFIAWIAKLTNDNPSFTLEDNVFTLDYNEESIELFDQVTVSRSNKNAMVAGEAEDNSLDRQDITFNGAFYGCRLYVLESFGCYLDTATDYFYNGVQVAHGKTCHRKSNEIMFQFLANTGADEYYWHVQIRGTPEEYMGTGIDLDTEYTATLEGTDGDNPAPEISSPLVPNNTIAEYHAHAYLRQQGNGKVTSRLETLWNPYFELGNIIKVKEGIARITGNFHLESISTTGNKEKVKDQIEVIKYEL